MATPGMKSMSSGRAKSSLRRKGSIDLAGSILILMRHIDRNRKQR